MQAILSFSLAVYVVFYVFESPIRYAFYLAHADTLIFIRDGILILALAALFVQQLAGRKIHPAFFVFMGAVFLHGTVMFLNFGKILPVVYGAKLLLGVLAGAVIADKLFEPDRRMVLLFGFLWVVSVVGLGVDKYNDVFPWANMETTIGDRQVDISHDWQLTGADKRAGGFMRSSIHAATMVPLLALLLIFNLRNVALRVGIALTTLLALYWTTQKGSLLAFAAVAGIIAIYPYRTNLLRAAFCVFMFLAVAMPIILPQYHMPQSDGGVFSFTSFYLRVNEMWPQAWAWIHCHELFPFGVGLGGIGGAQRFYAPDEINYADNMFVLCYAYFGLMTVIYFGWIALKVMVENAKDNPHVLSVLVFLVGYGCVVPVLEDQMGALFTGAAAAWLVHKKSELQA